jgi:acetyl-CoA synthetase
MLKKFPTYNEVYNSFQWNIPEFCNIGVDVCDRWANDKKRLALVFEDENGKTTPYTFHDIKLFSNKLANGLIACGIKQGDRVGILLPQSPETAIAHVATYKIAAIAIPLFTLFGTDALQYRLENSEAKAIVTNADNLPKILELWENLPHLKTVIVTDGDHPETIVGFWDLIEKGSQDFSPVKTKAEDPALIIYTSGTTGPPKGTLHAHRTVLGHLPGVEFPQNFFPQKGDFFWTPADWAWIGGLIDVLLPSWHHGIPVLAHRARKFDPEEAFHLLSKHRIRNAFMPPTALKLMRQVSNPRERYSYDIRSIGSGGETLGEELLQWGKKELGVSINEFYGQTECNLVVGCCSEVMEIRPGSMGKPIPGRVVEVIDQNGNILPPGTIGEIAVLRPDPVMFLEYWKNPEATQKKFINDWLLTGDTGKKDEDGYLWFNGRTDDIITSSGYRIGPAEIEDCMLKHPAVTMAAVIGSPDPVRTEIVKAFVMLKPDLTPSTDLESELKEFVKTRLAAHEYPREIEFVDKLPMTATGKIVRRELKQLEVDRKKGETRDD